MARKITKTAAESIALDREIYERAKDGAIAKVIATELGVTKSTVQRRINKMIRDGTLGRIMERRKHSRAYCLQRWAAFERQYRGVRLGSMSSLFDLLTEEQVRWMYDHTPDGCEVVTFLASVIRDAYADEHMHPAEILKGEK